MIQATPEAVYELIKNDPQLKTIVDSRLVTAASRPSVSWNSQQQTEAAAVPGQQKVPDANPLQLVEKVVTEFMLKLTNIENDIQTVNKNLVELGKAIQTDMSLLLDTKTKPEASN
jgi:hypothetical protein